MVGIHYKINLSLMYLLYGIGSIVLSIVYVCSEFRVTSHGLNFFGIHGTGIRLIICDVNINKFQYSPDKWVNVQYH